MCVNLIVCFDSLVFISFLLFVVISPILNQRFFAGLWRPWIIFSKKMMVS